MAAEPAPLPDFDDSESLAAYRRELARVALPLRFASFLVTAIGGALAILSHDRLVSRWLALAVIAIGGALMIAASLRRARYHRQRMADAGRIIEPAPPE